MLKSSEVVPSLRLNDVWHCIRIHEIPWVFVPNFSHFFPHKERGYSKRLLQRENRPALVEGSCIRVLQICKFGDSHSTTVPLRDLVWCLQLTEFQRDLVWRCWRRPKTEISCAQSPLIEIFYRDLRQRYLAQRSCVQIFQRGTVPCAGNVV